MNNMSLDCSRCGDAIGADEVRYDRRADGEIVETFCSVNCLADTDVVDEETARERLFSDTVQA